MSADWTTPAELRAQVRRQWEQGRLLAALSAGDLPFPLRLALRCPASADCSQRFDEVRAWSQALQEGAAAGYRLELREWRHPVIGRNALPQQAWVDTLAEALRFIDKTADARRFEALLAATRERQPLLVPWLRQRPLQALALAGAWPRLLEVVQWLQAHPRPGIYLRQVDLPGIDSKFIEQQRAVLAELLDLALPAGAIDARATGGPGFVRRYGFRERPVRIRFRSLDSRYSPLGAGGAEDVSADSASFARLDPPVSQVFITENEINFLAFPPAPRSLVVFGAGYGLDVLGQVPWLAARTVYYWGDIDTHGFAILDELRAHLPQARSLLMDAATLLAHQSHWSEEAKPTQRDLSRLTADERTVYDTLRWQRLAPRALRLEQERVGYAYVESALSTLASS